MFAVRVPLLLVILTLVFTSCAEASPPDRYVGMTRAQAIERAKKDIIALYVAFNGISAEKAAAYRRKLDARQPWATKSVCRGHRAWKIVWPPWTSKPIFVTKSGIVMACYVKR